MNIKQVINTILNNINIYKKYTIIPYTEKTYLICMILRKYCIQYIYILDKWMFIYFKYDNLKKKLIIKTFNLKNKKNFYTVKKLKHLKSKLKDGIIFTSKGVCSINTAIKLNQGGVLFCIIYFF